MPEGPFGFPRLTSIGPLVSEDPNEVVKNLTVGRGHSYRNWEPEEFIQLLESDVDKAEVREVLNFIESGRFNNMLKATYSFWIRLDPDELEEFQEDNPGIIRWLEVYARAEDLRPPSEIVDV